MAKPIASSLAQGAHQPETRPVAGQPRVAVVIPSYRVTAHIQSVISKIGPEVSDIIVVDDACPDGSGDLVEGSLTDPRVCMVRHAKNQGVGGAVISGYRRALELG